MVKGGFTATKRFAPDHPEWVPILKACCELADKHGEFTARDVLDHLAKTGWEGFPSQGMSQLTGIPKRFMWFPGLLTLERAGLIQHAPIETKYRKKYYTVIDPKGVLQALQELASEPVF